MSAEKTETHTPPKAQAKPAPPPTEPEPTAPSSKDRSLEKEAGEEMDWEKAGEPKYAPLPKETPKA
jgi:hypothetical protein